MDKKHPYNFYGCEKVGCVRVKNNMYKGIYTPLDLYDVLSEIWCAQTCAPRLRTGWTKSNKTLGQCSITAFLVQDIFGGEVRGMATKNGIHCYNSVDGVVFDLTSEQFGEDAINLVYSDADEVQDRMSDNHFGKEEKRLRYEYLNAAFSATYQRTGRDIHFIADGHDIDEYNDEIARLFGVSDE